MDRLTLKIVTPSGSVSPIHCDSIHLTVHDDKNGRGGGSYGIRAGEIKTLFAVDNGPLTAYHEGNVIFSCKLQNGFATVIDNLITVTVEGISDITK